MDRALSPTLAPRVSCGARSAQSSTSLSGSFMIFVHGCPKVSLVRTAKGNRQSNRGWYRRDIKVIEWPIPLRRFVTLRELGDPWHWSATRHDMRWCLTSEIRPTFNYKIRKQIRAMQGNIGNIFAVLESGLAYLHFHCSRSILAQDIAPARPVVTWDLLASLW